MCQVHQVSRAHQAHQVHEAGGVGCLAAARLLRGWRERRGVSQGALALRAGVSRSAVSRWEAGARLPRGFEVTCALDALRVSPAERLRFFSLTGDVGAARGVAAQGVAGDSGASAAHRLVFFGQVLREARGRRGWTQAQVAECLGVRQGTVSKWERSRDRPSPSVARALCDLLGIAPGSGEADLVLRGGLAYVAGDTGNQHGN